MSTNNHWIFIATVSAMTAAAPAAAQSLRCGTDLVHVGDNKATVQMKCGEPTAKDSFCKPQTKGGVCETVDEWTYNPGAGQFIRTLRFESGKLVSITYGDYGK